MLKEVAAKIFLCILSSTIIEKSDQVSNKKENEIIISLINHLKVHRCIFLSETAEEFENVKASKVLSREKIFAASVDFDKFERINKADIKVMIIVKIKNMAQLTKFLKFTERTLLNQFSWIVVLPENQTKKLDGQIYIPYNCEFYIMYPTTNLKFEILELYQIKPKTNIIKRFYASWSQETGLKTTTHQLEQRRRNMKNFHLILETQNELPCTYAMECYQREIWDDMAKMLNFTTIAIPKAKMGNMHPDAYLKITSLNSIIFRESIVAPIMFTEIKFYIKYEKQTFQGWKALFKPFNINLWIAFIIWFITTTLTIVFIGYIQSIINKKFTLTDYLFTSLDSITSQEGSITPNKLSIRITIIAIRIASAIILPAYSAAITSFLTVSLPKIPFKDLYSFVDDGSYTIGSINNSYPVNFLQETNDEKLSVIREKYLVPLDEMPINHQEALLKVCDENFAFMGYNNQLEMVRHLYPNACKILEISPPLFILPTGILLAENSPFKDIFVQSMIFFREPGILKLLNKKLQNRDFTVAKDPGKDFQPLKMKSVQPILLVGIIGLLLSITISVLEIFWFHIVCLSTDSSQRSVGEPEIQ